MKTMSYEMHQTYVVAGKDININCSTAELVHFAMCTSTFDSVKLRYSYLNQQLMVFGHLVAAE